MGNLDNLAKAIAEENNDLSNSHTVLSSLGEIPEFVEGLGSSATIIDIGAAHGELVRSFKRAGFRDTRGFDATPSFGEMYPDDVETASIHNLPLGDGIVDLAISSRLFTDPDFYGGRTTTLSEVTPGTDVSRVCNEMIRKVARVLREGGIYLISGDFYIPLELGNEVLFERLSTQDSMQNILRRTDKIILDAEIERLLAEATVIVRATERETVSCFGNDFYMLFLALKSPSRYRHFIGMYADKANVRYRGVFLQFLRQNQGLLHSIYGVLDQFEIYSELKNIYDRLLADGETEKAENLSGRIDPELGLEAIGITVLKALNPLLQEAATKMEELGISSEDFFSCA